MPPLSPRLQIRSPRDHGRCSNDALRGHAAGLRVAGQDSRAPLRPSGSRLGTHLGPTGRSQPPRAETQIGSMRRACRGLATLGHPGDLLPRHEAQARRAAQPGVMPAVGKSRDCGRPQPRPSRVRLRVSRRSDGRVHPQPAPSHMKADFAAQAQADLAPGQQPTISEILRQTNRRIRFQRQWIR